eukprot:COSAG02_NODE_1160_length_14177_cov_208.515130_3_plen_123_part_00
MCAGAVGAVVVGLWGDVGTAAAAEAAAAAAAAAVAAAAAAAAAAAVVAATTRTRYGDTLKTGCCPGSAQPWREELFGACEHKLCCVRFSRLDDIVSAVEFLHFNPTCSRLATKSHQSMCVGP